MFPQPSAKTKRAVLPAMHREQDLLQLPPLLQDFAAAAERRCLQRLADQLKSAQYLQKFLDVKKFFLGHHKVWHWNSIGTVASPSFKHHLLEFYPWLFPFFLSIALIAPSCFPRLVPTAQGSAAFLKHHDIIPVVGRHIQVTSLTFENPTWMVLKPSKKIQTKYKERKITKKTWIIHWNHQIHQLDPQLLLADVKALLHASQACFSITWARDLLLSPFQQIDKSKKYEVRRQ